MSPPRPRPPGRPPWPPGPPPWVPGPPPWAGSGSGERWTIIEYYHSWVGDTLYISLRTDIPCHLWLYWTDIEERMHERTKIRRGVRILSIPDFCLPAWRKVEQNEAGDTEWHTFDFGSWADCQRRWWFFFGEEGGIASPSSSPIVTAHYEDYEKEESMRHIDLTHKEVAGVIDHADRSVTADKLELNLDGVAIGLDADKLDGKHADELPHTESAYVYHAFVVSFGIGVWHPIEFTWELWDTDAMFDPAVSRTNVYINTSGKYHIQAHIAPQAHALGWVSLGIYKNGVTWLSLQNQALDAGRGTYLETSVIADLLDTDYLQLMVHKDVGGVLTLINFDPVTPHITLHRLS